jgi:phosphohistidine phosphatase
MRSFLKGKSLMQDKPDYYYEQSAVIPYRDQEGKLEILMISSRKKRRWVIPKGIKEPDLSLRDSAVQEALEEAGIKGRISRLPIGVYQYDKWGGTCTVTVFTMEVEVVSQEWEESYRDREWVTLQEASARVDEAQLSRIIQSLPACLDEDMQQQS